jgi:hypothetical protein
MTIVRAAFAMALLTAGSALAEGQATFYSWANFGGQDVTLSDSSREFNVGGAAPESALIRSGRWQICTRPDFLGRCTVLEPGEYPKIGEQFGFIASAREIDTIAAEERDYRRYWVERGRRGYR